MATRPRKLDADELRARNAELERERELLNAIANHAPSLLCLVDADGRVRPLATNIAFERALGYDPSESGGDLFWELYVPAADAGAVREAIEETIRDGTVTNVAKYSQASKAIVRIAPVGECLIVDVEDDGVGGADASAGTGLRGLADRVAARDGVFTIESEPGSGTHVHAEIPLG